MPTLSRMNFNFNAYLNTGYFATTDYYFNMLLTPYQLSTFRICWTLGKLYIYSSESSINLNLPFPRDTFGVFMFICYVVILVH